VVALGGGFSTLLWLLAAAAAGYPCLLGLLSTAPLAYRGVQVTRDAQADLMAVVDDVMKRAGLRRLDGVWLAPSAQTFALRGRRDWRGRRRVGIAVGLLNAAHLSVDELSALLAHEVGHLTDSHALRRLLARRRRGVLRRLNQPLMRPLRWYWRWFLKVTREQGVESERHADAVARQICGADMYARAIQRGGEASIVHALAMKHFVRPCWDQRITPATLFEAYEEVWTRMPERVAAGISRWLQAPAKPEDTHPGFAEITGGQIVPLPPDLRGNLPLAQLEELDRRCTASLRQQERHYPMTTVTWAEIWARRKEQQAAQAMGEQQTAGFSQSRAEPDKTQTAAVAEAGSPSEPGPVLSEAQLFLATTEERG